MTKINDRATTTPTGTKPERSNRTRMLRRYGPFGLIIVIVAIIALVTLVFSGGDDDETSSGGEVASQEKLIRSGPMTPAKAELLGEENVDFGPNCDTERVPGNGTADVPAGTVAIPTNYAPPCVAPFTGDNGGDTSQGVTGDTIKV